MRRQPEVLSIRLERHTMRDPNSGCWLWTGQATEKGYGRIEVAGSWQRAHRVSYEVHTGPIPPGMFVLHSCDIPYCINPDHLRLGTHQDNMDDMRRRGRGRGPTVFGEAHPHSRLTNAAVLDIRKRELPLAAYAERYGVCLDTVCRVSTGRIWQHI